tara:strand:+ start:48567 stop:49709 length:1143 start_codon:yes stop_codon:yes gene_type:complete
MNKIMIHALGVSMGGAWRHLTNFLPELGKQDTLNLYTILIRESFQNPPLPSNFKVETISDKLIGNSLYRLYNDNFRVKRKLKLEKFDAIVSLTNFGPIRTSCKHILFQRNPIYFCDYYLDQIDSKEKLAISLRKKLTIETMKRADLIVTPSNAMGEMIKKSCIDVTSKKFKTLYHGFSYENMIEEPLSNNFKEQLKTDKTKFFYPTHAAKHKGFEILLKAITLLKERSSNFKVFTPITDEDWPSGVKELRNYIHDNKIEDFIVFMGRIPQNQIGWVYKLCDCMVYPSLCESFGFSMIESIFSDLPIIASGTNINEEICGPTANYYSPLDSEDLANSMESFIRNGIDKKIFSNLAKKHREKHDWSWQHYTTEFIEILNHTI